MEIQDILTNLLLRFPLFGSVIVNLKFELVKSLVPVVAYTDGQTIFFKESLFEDYTEDEREFIIAHEVMHIVFKHIFRGVGLDKDLRNFVTDAIINQYLVKSGMTMPDRFVNVTDALLYSAEELYIKYLDKIDDIKKWMQANTYHTLLNKIDEIYGKMYSSDLFELMDENDDLRGNFCADMQSDALKKIQKMSLPFEMIFPAVNYGKAPAFANWRYLLRKSLQSDDKSRICFYEFEMDGILRREYKADDDTSETEVVIDTSASMSMGKIKVIIRECKNILKEGTLRVGFCDQEFFGWNTIRSEEDIDNLEIEGRRGTSLSVMASSFSSRAQNKIVITDGGDVFPDNRPDILWIILEKENIFLGMHNDLNGVDYIVIDPDSVKIPSEEKKLVRR